MEILPLDDKDVLVYAHLLRWFLNEFNQLPNFQYCSLIKLRNLTCSEKKGIEPPPAILKTAILATRPLLFYFTITEGRIELPYQDYEACILPLNYSVHLTTVI
jgi:hypothetical protein